MLAAFTAVCALHGSKDAILFMHCSIDPQNIERDTLSCSQCSIHDAPAPQLACSPVNVQPAQQSPFPLSRDPLLPVHATVASPPPQ